MKVSNNNVNGPGGKLDGVKGSKTENAQGVGREAGIASNRSHDIKDSTNVALSERAQMLKKAKNIASEQTVDAAKVARLQKMIDEGKYNVDASKIADRLVDQHMAIPDEP